MIRDVVKVCLAGVLGFSRTAGWPGFCFISDFFISHPLWHKKTCQKSKFLLNSINHKTSNDRKIPYCSYICSARQRGYYTVGFRLAGFKTFCQGLFCTKRRPVNRGAIDLICVAAIVCFATIGKHCDEVVVSLLPCQKDLFLFVEQLQG